jgi:hypothetical protein
MNCRNKRCRHNEDGKCQLEPEEISITNVGECAKESWRK